jgi:hypothetical protein
MTKMINAASGKTKTNGRDVEPVAPKDNAIRTDVVDDKSPKISNISAVAS